MVLSCPFPFLQLSESERLNLFKMYCMICGEHCRCTHELNNHLCEKHQISNLNSVITILNSTKCDCGVVEQCKIGPFNAKNVEDRNASSNEPDRGARVIDGTLDKRKEKKNCFINDQCNTSYSDPRLCEMSGHELEVNDIKPQKSLQSLVARPQKLQEQVDDIKSQKSVQSVGARSQKFQEQVDDIRSPKSTQSVGARSQKFQEQVDDIRSQKSAQSLVARSQKFQEQVNDTKSDKSLQSVGARSQKFQEQEKKGKKLNASNYSPQPKDQVEECVEEIHEEFELIDENLSDADESYLEVDEISIGDEESYLECEDIDEEIISNPKSSSKENILKGRPLMQRSLVSASSAKGQSQDRSSYSTKGVSKDNLDRKSKTSQNNLNSASGSGPAQCLTEEKCIEKCYQLIEKEKRLQKENKNRKQ